MVSAQLPGGLYVSRSWTKSSCNSKMGMLSPGLQHKPNVIQPICGYRSFFRRFYAFGFTYNFRTYILEHQLYLQPVLCFSSYAQHERWMKNHVLFYFNEFVAVARQFSFQYDLLRSNSTFHFDALGLLAFPNMKCLRWFHDFRQPHESSRRYWLESSLKLYNCGVSERTW